MVILGMYSLDNPQPKHNYRTTTVIYYKRKGRLILVIS